MDGDGGGPPALGGLGPGAHAGRGQPGAVDNGEFPGVLLHLRAAGRDVDRAAPAARAQSQASTAVS